MKIIQVFEGVLSLEQHYPSCVNRPKGICDQLSSITTGIIRNGKYNFQNIANIERLLWHLNGKRVKVTVEVDE